MIVMKNFWSYQNPFKYCLREASTQQKKVILNTLLKMKYDPLSNDLNTISVYYFFILKYKLN